MSCCCLCRPRPENLGSEQDGPFSETDILTQANMTLGRASNREWLFFLKPIKKIMGKTAVLDTGRPLRRNSEMHTKKCPSAECTQNVQVRNDGSLPRDDALA